MNIKPIGKNVLIKIKQKEEKKGLLIVNPADSDPIYADVIEVGNDVKHVKVNQVVMIFPYGGRSIDNVHKFVMEDDILGIVKE